MVGGREAEVAGAVAGAAHAVLQGAGVGGGGEEEGGGRDARESGLGR